jgi:hypothetical protein
MKSWMVLVLATGCVASKLTHYRSGWSSCRAADQNLIQCGGKQMAQVECYRPEDESCGALAIHYADGERVFLFRPPGFEPGQEDSLEPGGALRPELASNGSSIWFKPVVGGKAGDDWTVFEPQTGQWRKVGPFEMFQIRERDPHSMPLWTVRPTP